MNILFLVLIIIIIAVLYAIHKKNKYSPSFVDNKNIKKIKKTNIVNPQKKSKYIDDILKKYKSKKALNPFFVEIQIHPDYADVIDACDLLEPSHKEIFNLNNNPIIESSPPLHSQIKKITKKFIKEINSITKNNINDKLGWNKSSPNIKSKSGWDDHMKSLGLPPSIYAEPAGQAPITLIKIDHIEKYDTETETKYLLFLIVQKTNSNDQMIIKVSFVIDKKDINLDREFFNSKKNKYETSVKIESIFVVGFLTKQGTHEKSTREKFYDFDNITDGKMFNDSEIIQALNKKQDEINKEMNK